MTGYVRVDTSNNIADGNVIAAADLDNEFDGVVAAFNATTGHTHGGGVGEGAPITKLGPTNDVTVSASLLAPKTTNTVDIGSSLLKFKDLYLAGNASIGGTLAVTGATTLSAALTYGGVTLGNAVTGTGNMVLSNSPTLVTPALGTPTSVTLTNATGLPISTGVSGLGTGVATALAVNVGSAGAPVVNGGALGTPSSGVVTNLTGTASININGTVGATTANTGAFTTLAASGAVTLSGGTANAVAFLNGSKVLTTGSALTFDGANLGLGVTASSVTHGPHLDVGSTRGTVSIGTGYIEDNGTTQFFNGVRPLAFGISGTEGMRLTSTGLGIGTSSPLNPLHVSSAGLSRVRVESTGAFSADVAFYGSGATIYGVVGYSQTKGGLDIDYRVNPLTFSATGTERMRIDSAGNVGIGTSSPSTRLHVVGGDATFGGNAVFSSSALITASSGNFLRLGSNGTERMRIDSSGNLGLGVTPSAWASNYSVFELGRVGHALFATKTSANNTLLTQNAYFDGVWKYGYSSVAAAHYEMQGGIHKWYTAPSGTAGNAISFTQAMTLDASGRLALGTTTANEILNIYSSANTYIGLYNSTSGTTSSDGGYLGLSGTNLEVRNKESGNLTLWTANTEHARITSSGALLIGRTSPLSGTLNTTNTSGIEFRGDGKMIAAINANSLCAFKRYTSTGQIFEFWYDLAQVGNISVTGSATSYNTSSDYRLKNITGPITTSGAYIDSLNPVEGTWKADGSTFVGLIAHEVQEASRTTVATGVKDGEEMQGMDYSSAEIIANLIAEVKALRIRVAALEAA